MGEIAAALGNYCHHRPQPPSLRHVARSHRNLGHRHCRGRLLGAAGLPARDTGDARRNCRQSRCLGVIGLRFLRYVLSEASFHRCFTNIFKPWWARGKSRGQPTTRYWNFPDLTLCAQQQVRRWSTHLANLSYSVTSSPPGTRALSGGILASGLGEMTGSSWIEC